MNNKIKLHILYYYVVHRLGAIHSPVRGPTASTDGGLNPLTYPPPRQIEHWLRANIDWESAISLQRGQLYPKFQLEGVAPTNHSSQKTRVNDLSCGIKIWTDLSFVLSHCTRLTDGQTDRRTDTFLVASPRWHSMQRGKNLVFLQKPKNLKSPNFRSF